jgi:hypothetical protein
VPPPRANRCLSRIPFILVSFSASVSRFASGFHLPPSVWFLLGRDLGTPSSFSFAARGSQHRFCSPRRLARALPSAVFRSSVWVPHGQVFPPRGFDSSVRAADRSVRVDRAPFCVSPGSSSRFVTHLWLSISCWNRRPRLDLSPPALRTVAGRADFGLSFFRNDLGLI